MSAVLLLVTGAYVVFYGLSPGGVVASIEALGGPRLIAWDDPVG